MIENIIVQCCDCKKVRIDDKQNIWKYKPIPDYCKKNISHGYCPDCFEKAIKEIPKEEYKK